MDGIRKLDPESAQRLERRMDERRVELRIRWKEVAQRADMSTQNLSLIRKGKIGLTKLAERAIEDALDWMPGSIDAILIDGSATEVAPRIEVDPLRDEVEKELWAVGKKGKLPDEEIWPYIDRYRAWLAGEHERLAREAEKERRARRADSA